MVAVSMCPRLVSRVKVTVTAVSFSTVALMGRVKRSRTRPELSWALLLVTVVHRDPLKGAGRPGQASPRGVARWRIEPGRHERMMLIDIC